MKLLIGAILSQFVFGHTEEEYWAGWKEFLTIKDVQDRHHSYSTQFEHDKRFEIFKANMDKIMEHNNGDHSWKMGITQFSDMTPEEFKSYISCGNMKHEHGKSVFDAPKDWNKTATSSVDWVAKGAVTAVKNQGQCGSCWAFSTTGAIEGRFFISSGKLISLSEQDLVDCSELNSGCLGGYMDFAFTYVESNGGLCSEADYPYLAQEQMYCEEDLCTKHGPISGYNYVDISTSALEAACSQGPVSVTIEADQSAFQQYSGGVLTATCGTGLDHAVLLVGYGTDGGDDYWKLKNSWGEHWGESGYIRLCRNCNANNGKGQCGILMFASYPAI